MGQEIIGVTLAVNADEVQSTTQTVGELRQQLQAAEQSAAQLGESMGQDSDAYKVRAQQVEDIRRQFEGAATAASSLAEGVQETAAPVASMRARLREATAELIQMQEQFGELSPEALAAARDVAGLRDQIQEANEVAGLFDPGRTFQAVTGAVSAVAGGFAAAQGFMALLGVQSKEVEQALLKVQAAAALSQGLSTIKDSVKDFQRLQAVIQGSTAYQKLFNAATVVATVVQRAFGVSVNTTSTAFKLLRGAIIATGIGALVVLLGSAIEKLQSFANAAEEAAEKQKQLNEATKEWIDKAKQYRDLQLEDIDIAERAAIAKAKAEGKGEDEIEAIRKAAYQRRLSQQRFFLQDAKRNDEEYALGQRDLAKTEAEEKIRLDERAASQRDKAKADAEKADSKRLADRKAAEEKALRELEQRLQQERDAYKTLQDELARIDEEISDERVQRTLTAAELEKRALNARFQDRYTAYVTAGRDTTELRTEQQQQEADIDQKYGQDRLSRLVAQNQQLIRQVTEDDARAVASRVNLARAEQDAKVEILAKSASILQTFTDILGEQTAAGKALAIATATINAYLGISEVIKAKNPYPEPFGSIVKGLSIASIAATGFKTVASIRAVNVPGKGSGGGMPSVGAGAPINTPPTPIATNIAQDSVNAIGDASQQRTMLRAVVVESDITKSQDRIRRIENGATIE